ncbi:MAG TPA: alginate lyase family protein, partial [Nitrospira sp.]|nr:alginate lyase family protein [Nitrospira sp.]
MKDLAGTIRKLAGMKPPELRERGRQVLLKYGERLFGWEQGEMSDKAFRRRLVPLLGCLSVDTVADKILGEMRGSDFSRRPFMPFFGSREFAAASLRRRFPQECNELLHRADWAIDGRFDLLGLLDLSFGTPIDWHLDPTSGKRTGTDHWSRIDYLDPDVAGDKKVTWELNRHVHFVTLGQAYLLTKDERYADAFVTQLIGWLDANPPRRGINWASSLEVSFRSIAWLWALHCFAWSPRLTPAIIWRVLKSLVQHGAYVESYLSYYFAPNTHLTGEALGLLYLGTALPWLTTATRWRKLGLDILLEQLPKQVQSDGVYFEQASYYHRYTTDFYVHVLLLARANGLSLPPGVKDTVAQLLDHLLWITRPDGLSTLYGDEDGGRLLTLHRREAADFRDTLQIGAALFGNGMWKWAAGPAGPELLWLLGPEGLDAYDRLEPIEPDSVVRRFHKSGFVVLRDGWKDKSSYLFVDAGSHGGMNYVHAHADALSFEYAAAGVTWIIDPGTYTYTKDAALRDHFRMSSAHNTLIVEGLSQSLPDGPFSWAQVADTTLWRFEVTADAAMCRGEQNGYEHLNPPVRHQRSFHLVKRPDSLPAYVLIQDRIATTGLYQYQLRFHLASDCRPAMKDGQMVVG